VAIYLKRIKVTKEKIDKFFKGKCSKKEAEDFMLWIKSADADSDLVQYLQSGWDTAPVRDVNYKEHEVLKKINQIIDKKYPSYYIHPEKNSFSFKSWYRYAAVLLFVVAATFVLVTMNSGVKNGINEPQYIAITRSTDQGQKLRFQLPDNSMITLNSDSRLEYFENDSMRLVHISGEGFFEVARNEEKPFVVNAGKLKATVLGTSFNVMNREGINEASVSLVEGRLKVEYDQQDIQLIPGEQAIFESNSDAMKKDKWDYFRVFGWKEGVLYFQDAGFSEIIRQLELWYGVNMKINKDLVLKKHYSGKFNNEPLSNVLESLSFIYDFTYEINGKHVTIKFK
jgi:transmembrane sensor